MNTTTPTDLVPGPGVSPSVAEWVDLLYGPGSWDALNRYVARELQWALAKAKANEGKDAARLRALFGGAR